MRIHTTPYQTKGDFVQLSGCVVATQQHSNTTQQIFGQKQQERENKLRSKKQKVSTDGKNFILERLKQKHIFLTFTAYLARESYNDEKVHPL